MLEGK